MFKKFTQSDISTTTKLKSSVQRSIRASLHEYIKPEIVEQIWPKKEDLVLVKCRDRISIYVIHNTNEPLFFQHMDGPLYPSLRIVHKYPEILPQVKVDRGAIRYLLAGAHMMCPGFTSKGGYLPPPEEALEANTLVSIFAEGKEHAAAVGSMKLSSEEIKSVNKGVGVEVATYLGDDLWKMKTIGK